MSLSPQSMHGWAVKYSIARRGSPERSAPGEPELCEGNTHGSSGNDVAQPRVGNAHNGALEAGSPLPPGPHGIPGRCGRHDHRSPFLDHGGRAGQTVRAGGCLMWSNRRMSGHSLVPRAEGGHQLSETARQPVQAGDTASSRWVECSSDADNEVQLESRRPGRWKSLARTPGLRLTVRVEPQRPVEDAAGLARVQKVPLRAVDTSGRRSPSTWLLLRTRAADSSIDVPAGGR